MAFIREKKVRGRSYLQLVENYREGGKVKQRVIRHLGTREEAEKQAAAGEPPPPPSLTPPTPAAAPFPTHTPIWFRYSQEIPVKGAIAGWDGKWLTVDFGNDGDLIRQTRILPDRLIGRVFELGDQVAFRCCIGGLDGEHYGTVITASTQVEACPYPKRGRGTREIVRCPYELPGMVTIRHRWEGQDLEVTTSVSRVRLAAPPPPLAGHGKDESRRQLELC